MLNNHPVIKFTIQFFFPFIILYGFYIQLNGEISPGGGFQAGAIIASIFIAFDLILPDDGINKLFQHMKLHKLSIMGLSLYVIMGIIPLILGHNFLDYYALHHDKIIAQHIGIAIIELGVAITVFAVLFNLYLLFKER